MIKYKCKEPGCQNILGIIDDDNYLVIDSSRLKMKIRLEKGEVICKNSDDHANNKKEIVHKYVRG